MQSGGERIILINIIQFVNFDESRAVLIAKNKMAVL